MIGVIPCGKSKRSIRSKAKDLYTSGLFQYQKAFISQRCERWVILSALYGVVDPETEIDPYELNLRSMSAPERKAWQIKVRQELISRFGSEARYLTVAGSEYRKGIPPGSYRCPWEEIPDMRFGKQMGWMKRELENPSWK